jgi:hypothetical protein
VEETTKQFPFEVNKEEEILVDLVNVVLKMERAGKAITTTPWYYSP